jgi:N-acetylglucosaminyl-diphospho-decaprenol L-rhamnosyltransferase
VTRVAVVTLAHGRHDHLEVQHESLARSSLRPDHYVVVAMDDPDLGPRTRAGLARDVVHVPGDPRGLPLSAARNRGVDRALAGGADVVVLLDVDCLAGPQLIGATAAACVREPAVVWSGVVTYLPERPAGGYALDRLDLVDDPHPARPDPGRGRTLTGTDPDLFWSLCFGLSATAWRRSGGFDEQYVGYGGEDTDFGHRVVEAGLEHGVLGEARAYHQWHPVSSPPVEHLDDILRNAAIFHARWGWWPMRGWLEAFEERGLVAHRGHRWVRAARPAAAAG